MAISSSKYGIRRRTFKIYRKFFMKEIKIKYLVDGLEEIKKIDVGDWIDLRCAKRTILNKGKLNLIPLGIAMQLPKGYEAHIVPRSSTFKTWGILQTNSMGIIDESYCGDNDQWFFPAYATKRKTINKNDRICQFRIIKKMEKIIIKKVKTLGNKDRKGFGSTGEK